MNLVYGEVVEVIQEAGMQMGKIRVGGALRQATLDLIDNPLCGDRVLLCDGVAIGKIENETTTEKSHVPCHTR